MKKIYLLFYIVMVSEIEPKEKQTKKRGRKPKVIKEEKKAMPSVIVI